MGGVNSSNSQHNSLTHTLTYIPVLNGYGVCGEVVVFGLDPDEEGAAPAGAHDLPREHPRLERAGERALQLLDEQLHELPVFGGSETMDIFERLKKSNVLKLKLIDTIRPKRF